MKGKNPDQQQLNLYNQRLADQLNRLVRASMKKMLS